MKLYDLIDGTFKIPTKKDESYRYFNVEKLFTKEYRRIDNTPKEIVYTQGNCIEIIDGVVSKVPYGVRVYYEKAQEIAKEHFDDLYYVGHFLSPYVIKIEIDGDSEIEILHRYTQSNALIVYRIVVENQKNRNAILYENFESKAIENSLVLYGYDMDIAKDSTLSLIKVQSIEEENYALIASHYMKVQTHGNLIFKSFDLGVSQMLQLLKVELESDAHMEGGHLLYLDNHAIRGTVSQIVHQGKNATSNQIAKNILDKNARGIFDALIKVEKEAKNSKTIQSSKSILLDETAYMIAKPQLEIYIDELEASHGATTGQLDEKQLFYLTSRGISEKEARKILVIAFANTLIETIKDTREQERIKNLFEKVFYTTKIE